jgi:nucleoside-diphosphate-sugar epimerase
MVTGAQGFIADLIARCYATTYEIPVAVTRLANVYGGGDRNWSRIVPDTARALARGERPVIRSDGTPERDYLYVEDAVDVYLAVARSLDDRAFRGNAWNAGQGRPVSVLELVSTLIAVSGKEVEPDIRGKAAPSGQIDRQYLDSAAIREQLGWRSHWTLEDGLRKAYGWYDRHLGGRSPSPPTPSREPHRSPRARSAPSGPYRCPSPTSSPGDGTARARRPGRGPRAGPAPTRAPGRRSGI